MRWGALAGRLCGVVLGVGLLSLAAARPARIIDNLLYDSVMDARASAAPDSPPEVVMVETDDESIAALGRFPWSRARFASLLDRLHDAGARAVLVTFLFQGAADPAGDAALERALRRDRPVVLAAAGGVILPPDSAPDPAGLFYGIEGLREPLAAFAKAAGGVGNGGLVDDVDGTFRRYALAFRRGQAAFPSLALAGLRAAGAPRDPLERLPLGEGGTVWLDYGLVRPSALTRLSFASVLKERPERLAPLVKGKWVVVVANHTGGTDLATTPLSPWTPSGHVHAYALLNLLREAPIRRRGGAASFAAACLASGLLLLLHLGGRPSRWLAAGVVLVGGPLAAAAAGLYRWGFYLEPALPVLAAGLSLAALAFLQWQKSLLQEGMLRHAFRRYFGRGIGARIVHAARGTQAAERRELTILFADLSGFTAFTDGAEPEQITEALRVFNDAAITSVEEFQGTIDKLIGDAVMAYWGYPLKSSDHAARAIRAALALRRRMAEANRGLAAKGLGPFDIRTGLATGTVTVGEFGNARFASHTAIGRAVNLAQRLQALAAPGEILVSPATRLQAHADLPHAFSERGPVSLKGFHEPVAPFCVETAS